MAPATSSTILSNRAPQFKDKFDRACVVHDYCYSSPWKGNPSGRSKCDIKFKELMDEICGNNLPCLATSRIYYLAVRSAASSLYELIQEEVEKGRVTCTIHKPHYSSNSSDVALRT